MNKVSGFTRALFAALTLCFVVGVAHASTSLTFVASDDELNVALEAAERGTIGSVAISERFYQEMSSRQRKALMRGLIARTFELGDRAVFMYRSNLDVELAEELLAVRTPTVCSAPIYLGKLYDSKNPTQPITLCGMMGDASEEGIRERLRQNNEYTFRQLSR